MSSESSNGSNGLGDTGTVVLEDKPDLKEPPMYQVVLLNDDFTPWNLLFTYFNPYLVMSTKDQRK